MIDRQLTSTNAREFPRIVDGVERVTRVDPKKFTASVLIAQILDGLDGYRKSIGFSDATTVSRVSWVRTLGRYLDEPDDKHLSLMGDADQLTKRLVDWELDLISRITGSTTLARNKPRAIRRFILHFLAQNQVTNEKLEAWAKSPGLSLGMQKQRSPLDEISNSERIALEEGCRAIVRAGDFFLEIGDQLLVEGQSPLAKDRGWSEVPDAVWGLRNLPLEQQPKNALDEPDLPYAEEVWAYLQQRFPETIRHRDHVPGNPLFVLLVPNFLYISAVRTLFHLRTDWPPEETKYLKKTDLEFSAGHVRVSTAKNRASKQRYRELKTSTSPSFGWNPGGLLRRATWAMKHARVLAPDVESFWISSHERFFPRRRSKLPSTTPTWIDRSWMHQPLHFLIEHLEIEFSGRRDLRRLRKTAKSIKAAKIGTLNGAAGDDHTVEVFRNHYAHTTTINVIAAQTVLSAQKIAFSKIGPNVVPEDAVAIADSQHSNVLIDAAVTTATESEIDRRLSVTACVAPENPPHNDEVGICRDAPFVCLGCSNAVIFKDHLPRLLAYKNILDGFQKTMPPQQFSAVHGQQLTNLEEVLSRFSQDEITKAEQEDIHLRLPFTRRN